MPPLRYFYIISFTVLIVAFVIIGSMSFSHVENNIIKPTANQNIKTFVDSFYKTVWRRHQRTIAYLPCKVNKPCPKTEKLQTSFQKFLGKGEEASIISFKIYDNKGKALFKISNNFNQKYTDDDSKIMFKSAAEGNFSSSLINDYATKNTTKKVIRSLLPILPHFSLNETPQYYIIEIIYDIDTLWGDSTRRQLEAFIIIFIILSTIFGMMFFMSSNAEHLLAKEHEANLDLVSAMASAEKENKEKSQFLANVSHELRTPLNAIIGFSEIIKDEVMGPINNQQYKDYISDIYLSGVHLLSLINDILDYSKAEAGKLTVDLADVDVTKIMKNSLRLVTPRANEAHVELIGEIPKKHYILHTDGKRLKQILLNLFSNAVKFTPENGTVTLYAWHNLTEDQFVVEIKDTGVGIAPKDISKVMATFGQVENKLSRRYEGTGLGLPLSNKLVELMGGKLDIQSEIGKGTTVSVFLPYVEEKGTGTFNEMDALKGQTIAPFSNASSKEEPTKLDNTDNPSISTSEKDEENHKS